MKKLLLILCLLFTSCAKAAPSCGFIVNIYGEKVQWKNFPIVFFIDNSIPPEYIDSIYYSANKWNNLFNRQLISIEKDFVDRKTLDKDGLNVISMPTQWPRTVYQQASTSVRWNGSQIIETDIIINRNFQFYSGHLDKTNKFNLESLFIHEFGHALGLNHINSPNNVMNPILRPNEERLIITQDIIDSLKCGGYNEKK